MASVYRRKTTKGCCGFWCSVSTAPELLRQTNSTRFKQDTVEQALRAQCFEPTLNVSGLHAGVVIEDGHKVIVPGEAVASIDIRPVAGMTIERTMAAIRRYLDNQGYEDNHA